MPAVRGRVSGKVVLSDAVRIVNLEDDQIPGVDRTCIAQCQGVHGDWCLVDVAPHIDDGEPPRFERAFGVFR